MKKSKKKEIINYKYCIFSIEEVKPWHQNAGNQVVYSKPQHNANYRQFLNIHYKKQSDDCHCLLNQETKPFIYLQVEQTQHVQELRSSQSVTDSLTSSTTVPAGNSCAVCRTLRMPRLMFSAQVCSLLTGQSFSTFPSWREK